jgi:hypothetical protein
LHLKPLLCGILSCFSIDAVRKLTASYAGYLAATGIDTGLLINFGKSVTVSRKFRIYRDPANPVNPVNPVLS